MTVYVRECALNLIYSGLQKPSHSLKRQGKDDMSSNPFRFLALRVNVQNCPLLRNGEREGLKINTPQAKGAGQEMESTKVKHLYKNDAVKNTCELVWLRGSGAV